VTSRIGTRIRLAALAGLLLLGGCGPLDAPAAPEPVGATVSSTPSASPTPYVSATPAAATPTAVAAPTPAATPAANPAPANGSGNGGGSGAGSGGGTCAADEYRNVDGQCIPRPRQADAPPPGATAQCNDGTYSFSTHRSGTCSHHGGVRRWL
jgi:Protein of unknown function (DUF3761)